MKLAPVEIPLCKVVSIGLVGWVGDGQLQASGDSAKADLLKAVFNQDLVEVRSALDAGADVDTAAQGSRTPLWGAVAYGNIEVVEVNRFLFILVQWLS